jgi:flavin-dependent dehydrogenase
VNVDTVVVGGGPAGAVTALRLAEAGQAVALLAKSFGGTPRIGESLPPAVRPVLAELGLWDRFLADGHVASPGIVAVWGRPDPFTTDFVFDPWGAGWHVDRGRFDAMLVSAAKRAGVRLRAGAVATGCTRRPDGSWELEASSGGRTFHVRAQFLVDATGRSPWLMRRVGSTRTGGHRLVGVVRVVTTVPRQPDQRMLVEAVEHGWWYSAPLPGGHTVATFMTDPDVAARGRCGFASLWRAHLRGAPNTAARLRAAAEAGADPGDVRLVAAGSSCRRPPCGRGWLAVGDAAAAYDPLSGHGVHRALVTAMAAADAIVDGSDDVLAAYADEIGRDFDDHVRVQAHHYAQERRWPQARFWQRRYRGYEGVA